MKKIFGAVILFFLPLLSSYGQENTNVSPDLSDITIKNFPVIDGSDSTKPLRLILASKLLGFDYVWQKSISGGQGPDAHPNEVMPKYTGDFDDIRELRVNRLKNFNDNVSNLRNELCNNNGIQNPSRVSIAVFKTSNNQYTQNYHAVIAISNNNGILYFYDPQSDRRFTQADDDRFRDSMFLYSYGVERKQE